MNVLQSTLATIMTGSAALPDARAGRCAISMAEDDARVPRFPVRAPWAAVPAGPGGEGPGDDDDDEDEEDDENERGGGNIDPDDDEGYDDEDDDDDEEPLRCDDRSGIRSLVDTSVRCGAAFRAMIRPVR